MYKNVGKKIQTLAKVLAWIGIIFFVLIGAFALYGGLNTSDYNMLGEGFVFVLIMPVVCWLSSLSMVGFGKLIETNEEMKVQLINLNKKVEQLENK